MITPEFSSNWKLYSEFQPSPDDGEVLCYSPGWVHLDFNPRGLRTGFMGGEGFISAFWWDNQDTYVNDEISVPLYWRPLDDFNTL